MSRVARVTHKRRTSHRRRERGVSIVHWLLAIIPLCGFAAFAVDFNNIYLSAGELQNAADAGALEGVRLLYNPDGSINIGQTGTSAIAGATATAQLNNSQGTTAEIVNVNRGHWEFRTSESDADGIERGGIFTANPATVPAPLVDVNGNFRTWQDLNTDPNEINAVEVVTARQLTAIQTFFGQFLGFDDYQLSSRAVAYVGFAGSIDVADVDFPIAMCEEILHAQACNVGRLVPEPSQTGGWTNLEPVYDGSCGGAANANEMRTLVGNTSVCGVDGGINPTTIRTGAEIQVNNGQINSAFDDMYDCWMGNADLDLLDANGNAGTDGLPDQPMTWTLPVVSGCRFGGDCGMVIGAVRVNVLWMFKNEPNNPGANSIDNTGPQSMGDWSASTGINAGSDCMGTDPLPAEPDGATRWNSFVCHHNLQMDDAGTVATFENGGAIQKTIYFHPDCDPYTLGGTGGNNYGIRAEVPVLVR